MIPRRSFITLLGGAAATWPVVARGQQSGTPVIGFLVPRSPGESPHLAAAFHRGLNEIGFIEGRNLAIEYRYANNRIEQIPALAADLVHQNVVVIAVFTTVSARAAKAATTTIPIVFLTGDDPVAAGLVNRLDRPDQNLTGVSFISATLGAKRLELLRSLVPKVDHVALLVDQNSPESQTMSQGVQKAANTLGQPIVTLNVGTESEISAAFESLLERRTRAFLLTGSAFTNARMHQFVTQAARHSIVGMYTNRDIVAAGGLISYGTSLTDAYRQAGAYAGRILRGARVADLPVLLPTKFALAINLKTAKALGLEIPPMLLALADEVVE